MRARNYYVYSYEDEPEEFIVKSFYSDEIDRMMNQVAHMIAFSDCTGEIVDEIRMNGRQVRYIGWRPEMYMGFADCETNEIVWEGYFPEWDH